MKSYRSVSSRMRGSNRRKGFRMPWRKVHAEIAEEDGWDTRPTHGGLVRAFFIILLIHVVIVGGIMINGWINQEQPPPLPDVSQDTVPGDAFPSQSPEDTVAPTGADDAADPTPDATAGTPATPADTRREPVRSGDTIASFASRHKTDGATVRDLNRIGTDSGIQVGQWLLVPDLPDDHELANNPADEAAREEEEVAVARPVTLQDGPDDGSEPTEVDDPPAGTSEEEATSGSSGRTHTVASGETAWGISRKYDVDVNKLLEINGITDPSALGVGTELKIP